MTEVHTVSSSTENTNDSLLAGKKKGVGAVWCLNPTLNCKFRILRIYKGSKSSGVTNVKPVKDCCTKSLGSSPIASCGIYYSLLSDIR